MNSQREEYIDGMKGVACLFVLLGHFTGIYKYAENATASDKCGYWNEKEAWPGHFCAVLSGRERVW